MKTTSVCACVCVYACTYHGHLRGPGHAARPRRVAHRRRVLEAGARALRPRHRARLRADLLRASHACWAIIGTCQCSEHTCVSVGLQQVHLNSERQ